MLEVELSQVKDAEKTARVTLEQLADDGLLDKWKPKLESKGDFLLLHPMALIILNPIHRL